MPWRNKWDSTSGDICQHSVSGRNVKSHTKNVISTHERVCQLNHVLANLAWLLQDTKFMAKVPQLHVSVYCVLSNWSKKKFRSLHNVAWGCQTHRETGNSLTSPILFNLSDSILLILSVLNFTTLLRLDFLCTSVIAVFQNVPLTAQFLSACSLYTSVYIGSCSYVLSIGLVLCTILHTHIHRHCIYLWQW